MFRVLVADPIEAEGIAALRAGGLEVESRQGLSEAALCSELPGFDALLVRSRTLVSARALEHAPRLRLITRAGIGVDNVDLAAASRRGVIVTNVPDATTTTTAEHAIALLLALARRIPAAERHLRGGALAIGVLGVDGELPAAALAALRGVEGIVECRALRLPAAP
jgi:D-3-phosphoglycerate dehydrogenase